MYKKMIFFGICWSWLLSILSLNADPKGMPDFLIVGVTKCGTTSLYKYLLEHPKILGANQKEVHFFDGNFLMGKEWYMQQFPEKTDQSMLVGEASPGYFWKRGCAYKIAQHCPKAKLIVMFRDPVKRVISEHFRCKRRGEEARNFEYAIIDESNRESYLDAGKYMQHLTRWLRLFPKEQIHVVILEDLSAQPEREVNKVFAFLGLENYKLNDYKICNTGKNKTEVINPRTIEYLKKYYKPYNVMLERFLDRKLPW